MQTPVAGVCEGDDSADDEVTKRGRTGGKTIPGRVAGKTLPALRQLESNSRRPTESPESSRSRSSSRSSTVSDRQFREQEDAGDYWQTEGHYGDHNEHDEDEHSAYEEQHSEHPHAEDLRHKIPPILPPEYLLSGLPDTSGAVPAKEKKKRPASTKKAKPKAISVMPRKKGMAKAQSSKKRAKAVAETVVNTDAPSIPTINSERGDVGYGVEVSLCSPSTTCF